MTFQRVNPESLAPARGFSHAVVAEGRVVFLAGQTALDNNGRVVEGDLVAQFEQALGNLVTALAAAGGRPDEIAALTIYVVDVDDYKANARAIREVWRRLAGSDYPAMALVGVTRLWDTEALLEVQGMAVLP